MPSKYPLNDVYNKTEVLDADFETIKIINKFYVKDINNVYYKGIIIKEADTHSIIFNNNYAYDNNKVYYYGKIMEGANVSTFQVFSTAVAKDDKFVYRFGIPRSEYDAPSFKHIGDNYYSDKNAIWYLSSSYYHLKTKELPSDLESIGNGYAKDNEHVYYEGEILTFADLSSFKLPETDNCDAEDDYNYYNIGQMRVR